MSELLERCVEDYIKSAVPISSGALSKQGGKSSATYRNELKTLEEMGYLRQVHTSGGRVPTTAGYKLYVDKVLGNLNISPGRLSFAADKISERVRELPSIVDDICKKLSSAFDYPIIVKEQFGNLTVISVGIIPLVQGNILVLIKTSAGSLSHVVEVARGLSDKECEDAASALNSKCMGLSLRKMMESLPSLTKELKKDLKFFDELCRGLAVKLEDMIEKSRKLNVVKLLDISDNIESAKKISSAMDCDKVLESDEVVSIDESSVVKFDLEVGGESIARVGILGPERMDYKRLIAGLYSLMSTAKEIEKIEGGEEFERRRKIK
jgi:heat-inducible transcriptional repressor